MSLIDQLISSPNKGLDTLSSKLIYIIIKNNVEADGWTTISVTKLGRMTGLSLNAVRHNLDKLIKRNLIEKERSKEGVTKASRYKVVEL